MTGKLEHIFTYHPPTETQKAQYEAIREAAMIYGKVMLDNTQPCADQSTALRKLRESVMTANAAIALGGVA